MTAAPVPNARFAWTSPLRKFAAVWLPPLLLMALAVSCWELAVWAFTVPDWLLPSPHAILVEIGRSSSLLFDHALTTGVETVAGFAVACLSGIALAVAISSSRLLERAIYPIVIASQVIPIIAISPLLLIWIGPEITSKVIVVALVSFFPITVNLVDGLRASDRELVNMFRTLGATDRQIFMKLRVPIALPYLFSGLKVAAVVAVIGAVIGEWVGAQGGLGWLIKISQPQIRPERVYAAILVLSLLAVSLFLAIALIEKWTLRHHPRGGTSERR